MTITAIETVRRAIGSANAHLQNSRSGKVTAEHKAIGQRLADRALGAGYRGPYSGVASALTELAMGSPGSAERLLNGASSVPAKPTSAPRPLGRTAPAPILPSAPEPTGEARRLAILDLPEAQGRGPMSEHLALETDVSVSQAKSLLAQAPVDPDEAATIEAKITVIAHRGAGAAPPADGWLARRIATRADADHRRIVQADREAAQARNAHAGTEQAEAVAILAAYRR